MSRKAIGLAGLLLGACALGAAAFWQYGVWEQERAREREAQAAAARLRAEQEALAKLPHADLDMARLPKGYPRPASAWRTAEKAVYRDIVLKAHADVLVAPFQVQDHAFSRALRSLMTAKLAAALGAAGSQVLDPYLVARTLGEGERRYDSADPLELATRIQARRVVVGYVGHDGKGAMRVTLHLYQREGAAFGRTFASRHFEKVAFSDTDSPLDAFERLLPEALGFLGVVSKPVPRSASTLDLAELPPQPSALWSGALADKAEPARDAYYLQLFALLAPRLDDRARERFIEKSLLAIDRMSPDSPDYRALKARALMHLGLRPAALAVLGASSSAEEKHVRAMLEGDLPALRANLPAVPRGVRGLLAGLEANWMEVDYSARDTKQAIQAAKDLKVQGDAWSFLAARAMMDWDLWTPQNNLNLMGLLDREFPLEGLSAETLLRGAQAVGDAGRLRKDLDLAVLQHVRRQAAKLAGASCCALAPRPAAADYLDLLAAVGIGNVLRQAKFLEEIQGDSQAALDFIVARDSGYRDHPMLTVVRGETLSTKGAYAAGFNVWYWEQGQSYASGRAYFDLLQRNATREYGADWENLYAAEYPYRADYPLRTGRAEAVAAAPSALGNATFEIYPLAFLADELASVKKWDELDALLASIGGRFNGHPRRTALLAQSSVRKGDVPAAEQLYRAGIALNPQSDSSYSALGQLLFAQGAEQRAFQALMDYPGMKNPAGRNPVGVASYAYDAGSTFYLNGYFQQALPFYKMAAALDTGSESSLSAATRLALLAGAWQPALAGSLQRARRYNSAQAYRDYLGMLHVMGHSKEAWAGFTTLIARMNAPQLWETALVGHRLEGATAEEIAEWAAKEPMNRPGGARPHAQVYLTRASITDRTPPKNFTAMVSAADPAGGTVTTTEKGALVTYRVAVVYFAEAYGALRRGDFEASRAVLQEAIHYHPVYFEETRYLLPYYAYVSARVKNTADAEAQLATLTRFSEGFDYLLARAALAGVAGKTDQALADLRLALHRRVLTGTRPVYAEYQYSEMCELLFQATNDRRYRELALDWARKVEKFQPWHAWPYAMEALYAPAGAERRRAMAMAYYLDRNSERLSRVPAGEVKAAVREFAGRNPFLQVGAGVRPEPI